MVLVDVLVLLVALAVLERASSKVIDSAVKLAQFFGVAEAAIGFVLVSVSTSLPELAVSVIASSAREGSIVAGNVFGSNIADSMLILGIIASFYVIRVARPDVKEIALVLLATSLITSGMIYTTGLGRLEGALLILAFVVYVFYLTRKRVSVSGPDTITKEVALRAFAWFCAGIVLVLVSAHFVVESAVAIANKLELAKSFVGATIVAVGTSLPELAIDIQAVRKKRYGLALGDAIGSMMANLTLVLGLAAFMNPIMLNMVVFLPIMLFAVAANTILFYFMSTQNRLARREGLVMLAFYALYLFVIFNVQMMARA
ncbi:MAG: sodium:calcium antiporter [Candidatus Micrarchaeia archaeon]